MSLLLLMPPQTIIDLFDEAVNNKSRPDALMVKKEGRYRPLSSEEIRSQVQSVAAGLMNLGLEPGDRVALLSENRPEWLVSDIAILSAGAINVPIYPTLPPTQIEGLLNDAGIKIIILSTPEQLKKIREIEHRVPSLQTMEPFAKFGSALGQPWVSPWERGRPARILVKALPRRQSAGEPTNPVKPIATTLPSLVRAGRPRSQGSQPFPAINPTYWRILQKAPWWSWTSMDLNPTDSSVLILCEPTGRVLGRVTRTSIKKFETEFVQKMLPPSSKVERTQNRP